MIDLFLDIVTLDEGRLKRRVFGSVFAIVVPILFLGMALVWASILAFVWLSSVSGDLVAAAVMCGASLLLAVIGLMSMRGADRRPRSVAQAIRARLAEPSEKKAGGASDDLLALALIIANHLDSVSGRKA